MKEIELKFSLLEVWFDYYCCMLQFKYSLYTEKHAPIPFEEWISKESKQFNKLHVVEWVIKWPNRFTDMQKNHVRIWKNHLEIQKSGLETPKVGLKLTNIENLK